MRKIEAIIKPSKLAAVRAGLAAINLHRITILDAKGSGGEPRETARTGDESAAELLPKVKLEIVVTDDQVEEAAIAVLMAARTGEPGDGKIFITHIEEAIRIRTDERGEDALRQPPQRSAS